MAFPLAFAMRGVGRAVIRQMQLASAKSAGRDYARSVRVSVKTSGGDKFRRLIEEAQEPSEVHRIEVGFFGEDKTAREGLPADLHAKLIEFGTADGKHPERPFMRSVVPDVHKAVRDQLIAGLRAQLRGGKAPRLTRSLAERIGEGVRERIEESMQERQIRDTGELRKALRVKVHK